MKYIIYIFYLEIIGNLLLIFQSIFFPASFVAQYSAQSAPVAFELARWYGVLLIPIVWILFRALQLRGKVLKLVLEAYLAFDLIQIAVALISIQSLGWAPYLVIVLPVEVILAIARLLYLWKPAQTGLNG